MSARTSSLATAPMANHGRGGHPRPDSAWPPWPLPEGWPCRWPAKQRDILARPISALADRIKAGAPIAARHLARLLAEEMELRARARLLAAMAGERGANPSAHAAIEGAGDEAC